MKGLNRMHKRWTVALAANVWANLDNAVRAQSQKGTVKRRMVQGAERKTVANMRLAFGLRVRNDVSRIEKLLVAEPAERALVTICL
jgi:hypothetical protein